MAHAELRIPNSHATELHVKKKKEILYKRGHTKYAIMKNGKKMFHSQ